MALMIRHLTTYLCPFRLGLLLGMVCAALMGHGQVGACGDSISCEPTLFQVYGVNDNQPNAYVKVMSYSAADSSATVFGDSLPGWMNATGYSLEHQRAFGIGCNTLVAQGGGTVCQDPRLYEIGFTAGSSVVQGVTFCDLGAIGYEVACSDTFLLRGHNQGDVIHLTGPNSQAYEFLAFREADDQDLHFLQLHPALNLTAQCASVNLVGTGWVGAGWPPPNSVADMAFDPQTGKLFSVDNQGRVLVYDLPLTFSGVLPGQVNVHRTAVSPNPFQFLNGNPYSPMLGGAPVGGTPQTWGNTIWSTFGASYISGDGSIWVTENRTGDSFRSTWTTQEIWDGLNGLPVPGAPFAWTLETSLTQGNLLRNDGFSCPTAELPRECEVPDCEIFLSSVIPSFSNPGCLSGDSCCFHAEIPPTFDANNQPIPSGYQVEWQVQYTGGLDVYQAVSLDAIDFAVPTNTSGQVCVTLSCVGDSTVQSTCCVELACPTECDISGESFEVAMDRVQGDSTCCHEVCPSLPPGSFLDPDDLCVYIDWGDGSPLEFHADFSACHAHCYSNSANCAESHDVVVYAFCCENQGAVFESVLNGLSVDAMVWTGCAACCPVECHVRSVFWVSGMVPSASTTGCEVTLKGTQFLGPDMASHNSPMWSSPAVGVTWLNSTALYDNRKFSAVPGTYSICRSLNGLAVDGSTCSHQVCHNVVVQCGSGNSGNLDCPEDLNGNGVVDVPDLLSVLNVFGLSCNP